MKRFVFLGLAAAVVALGGCQNQSQMRDDVAALKQENTDLKARVTTLESKVEAIAASLPDGDAPDDNSDSSN